MSDSGHSEAAAHKAFPTSWRCKRAWIILLLVCAAALASDLVSKNLAFEHIGPVPVHIDREQVLRTQNLSHLIPRGSQVTVIPYVLDLSLVLNRGAVFGIGAGKRWAFIGFTILAVGFAVWMFGAWTHRDDWVSQGAIGLLIGGGLGNLYDRLVFACVRDFLHPLPDVMLPFGWRMPHGEPEIWPYVSNIADLWLIIGIGTLMFCLYRHGRTHKKHGA